MTRLISLAIAALAACSMSCGGGSGSTTERDGGNEAAQTVALRFSSTDCSLETSGPATPGRIAFTLTNETQDEARVHVWRIDESHAFAEFSAHVEEEAARIDAGQEPIGAPDYVTLVTEIAASGENDGVVETTVAGGTYAFACFPWEVEQGTIYSAGPLVVGE